MTIKITHTHAEGTLATGTSRNDGTAEILKDTAGKRFAARFRWGRSIDCWYVPSTRDKIANEADIDKVAEELRAAGFTVEITIDNTLRDVATVEDERAERAEERVERYDGYAENAAGRADAARQRGDRISERFAGGQPILLDHHSAGKALNDVKRIDRALRTAVEESDKARHWEQRARASEWTAGRRESLGTTLRRIAKLEKQIRDLDRRPPSPTWADGPRARWTAERAQALAQVAYWRERVAEREAAGEKVWGPDDFKIRDWVEYSGSWYEVKRVNKKTLTIPSIVGGPWTDTAPYDGVTGRRSAEDMVAPVAAAAAE